MAQDCFNHISHKSLTTELRKLQFSTFSCDPSHQTATGGQKILGFPSDAQSCRGLPASKCLQTSAPCYCATPLVAAGDTPLASGLGAGADGIHQFPGAPAVLVWTRVVTGGGRLAAPPTCLNVIHHHSLFILPPSSLHAKANLILGLLIGGAFSQAFFQFTSISSSRRALRRRPPPKGREFSLRGS